MAWSKKANEYPNDPHSYELFPLLVRLLTTSFKNTVSLFFSETVHIEEIYLILGIEKKSIV